MGVAYHTAYITDEWTHGAAMQD